MYWHIDADLICIIFMLALFLALRLDKQQPNERDRCFRFCVSASIWMMVVDILASVAMERPVAHGLYVGLMTLYFAILLLGIAGWGRYSVTLIYGEYSQKAKLARRIVMIPYWVFVAATIVNLWTGWLFTIGADNSYVRGPLFAMAYYFYIFYALAIILLVCLKWRSIQETYLRSLLLLLPVLQGLGIYVQLAVPGWLTILPFLCAALMISYFFIQTNQTSQRLDEKRAQLRQAELAASTDAMTGLLNHKTMMALADEYLRHAGRTGSHVMLMIDLDNFKNVNDTLGHQIGDEVIIRTAEIIRRCFRETDLVARVGGDEFMVLMKNVELSRVPRTKAQELLEALQFTASAGEKSVEISGSVGMSFYQGECKSVGQLYAEADSALYQAKKAGKNRFANTDGVMDVVTGGESMSTIHLCTLLEHLEGGVVLLEVGENVQVHYVNPGFYHNLLCDKQEYPQQPESVLAQVWPEDLPTVLQAVRKAALTGQRQECVCRVGRQGERRHLLRMVRHSTDPMVGGIRKVICTVTDVTALFMKDSTEQKTL